MRALIVAAAIVVACTSFASATEVKAVSQTKIVVTKNLSSKILSDDLMADVTAGCVVQVGLVNNGVGLNENAKVALPAQQNGFQGGGSNAAKFGPF